MYIARDENNMLFFHTNKPYLHINIQGFKSWYSDEFFAISNDLFPSIRECMVAEIHFNIGDIEIGVINE